MKTKIGVISIVLILLASAIAATPVFAKNLNVPDTANRVLYYSGGEAIINLQSPLPNYPPGSFPPTPAVTTPTMKIDAIHVVIPNSGVEFSQLLIQFYQTTSSISTLHWEPFAIITTSSDIAAAKALWAGSFVEFPGTHYNPLYAVTDNVKAVSNADLQVERHGNNLYVNLAAPQQIQRPNALYFTIPAFSLKLNSFGGSFQSIETIPFTGYFAASGYTLNIQNHNFNANGAFTSSFYHYQDVPVSAGFVTMQGIQTFYPPASK